MNKIRVYLLIYIRVGVKGLTTQVFSISFQSYSKMAYRWGRDYLVYFFLSV